MMTQDQIDTFVNLVDEEAGIGISDTAVVETQDTIADFCRRWGAADEVSEGLHVWFKVQTGKGQPRNTLCVYDFGVFRAACH